MTTFYKPIKGRAHSFTIGLISQANTKLFQVNPTLAAGDVKITKDGGASANLTTLPTVTPAGGTDVVVSISAAEQTADKVSVTFSDVAGAEWCDAKFSWETRDPSFANFCFEMRDLGGNLKTGLGSAITAVRSIDGGAFSAGTMGAVSEVGNGTYKLAIPLADATYEEELILYFTANTAGIAQPTKITMTSAM